ncbi:MAG: hypothetical protein U5J83_04320 [Bryobacterales bacterium]|nr:hypothetical protein [Bryobacterales bacterium]
MRDSLAEGLGRQDGVGGFAAVLDGVEFGCEAFVGFFVFFAEFCGAVVEADGGGLLAFEQGQGDAGRGGGVGVLCADFGDAGIGDDALPGFYPAEEPGFLGDAEDEEFFGGSGWLVGAEVVVEEPFEGLRGFVLVEECVA